MHAPPASMDSASQPNVLPNALQRYRQRQKVRAVPFRCVAQLRRPSWGTPPFLSGCRRAACAWRTPDQSKSDVRGIAVVFCCTTRIHTRARMPLIA